MATYGPYSSTRQAGNLLFISGQVGVDPDTKTASTDITAQMTQAIRNIESLLTRQGLSLKDIVKTTVFLKNIEDFAAMNQVYVTFFDSEPPARSCVAAANLPQVAGITELLVEIEAVAYMPLGGHHE